MDNFKQFLANTSKKGKSIRQIVLSDYDYMLNFLIKKAYLPSYEKKHGVDLRETLADLYLDLNDYVPKEACMDCKRPANLVRLQTEGNSLYGALRGYCGEHSRDQYHGNQIASMMVPILFNSRYAVSQKGDRKKFDKFLLKSLGLKSTRSEKAVDGAIDSLEHVLSGRTRKDAKELLVDYMGKAPSARQDYRAEIRSRLFEMASDDDIFRLSWIMYPMLGEGVQTIYHDFKASRR